MTNVVSFEKKRKEKKSKQVSVDPMTVKLWQLSLTIDELIKEAIVQDNLPTEEVAAIFAHRLGSLIHCYKSPDQLGEFCTEVLLKQVHN